MVDLIPFEIVGHGYSKKAGKALVYKVQFKNGEGRTLTLVGGSRQIYVGYPIGNYVDVRIENAQTILMRDQMNEE